MAYPAVHTERNTLIKPPYSNALRCIGQTLESMDLKAVEVKLHGENYVVQGWSKGPLTSMEVDKHYAPEDLRRIDAEGRKRRRDNSDPPDLLSLSQVLRLAGNYVDRARGRLIRVSWQDQSDKIQSVTIQYEPYGRERIDESQVTTMEELCIHVYKQRKRFSSSDRGAQRPLPHIGLGAQPGLEAAPKTDQNQA